MKSPLSFRRTNNKNNHPIKAKDNFKSQTFEKKQILNKHEKISEILLDEFNENFSSILTDSKSEFIYKIISTSKNILSYIYNEKDLNSNEFKEEFNFYQNEIIEKKYNKIFNFLFKNFNEYKKNPKKFEYLTQFQYHCEKTEPIAYHNCEKYKAKLIIVKNEDIDDNNINKNNKNINKLNKSTNFRNKKK